MAALGIIMLVLLFGGLFVFAWIDLSFKEAVAIFAIVAGLVVFVSVAAWLIGGGQW